MVAGPKNLEICIVDDEADLREELSGVLLEAGFSVRGFPSSRQLYAALAAAPCDIAIIDIGLPGEDGFSITARLANLSKMGIIVLSARTRIEDRVRALQGGADVYLTKPVDLRELLAVVTSLARRIGLVKTQASRLVEAAPNVWSLSSDSWVAIAPNGISLPLTAQERLFLMRLWQNAGEAVPREELAIALDGDLYDYDFHRLDTLVSRLRRKAAELSLTLPLRAVRGTGYAITPASDRTAD